MKVRSKPGIVKIIRRVVSSDFVDGTFGLVPFGPIIHTNFASCAPVENSEGAARTSTPNMNLGVLPSFYFASFLLASMLSDSIQST